MSTKKKVVYKKEAYKLLRQGKVVIDMEKHFLRQFKASNKEESIKKIKDELTFLRARIEHSKREIEKLEEEINNDLEKGALLEQILDASETAEHFAIDFSIKDDKRGRLCVVIICEDGTRVAIAQELMKELAKAWSEI
jgi:flagellar motility protein MotE (MotC chaperone)